jgi:isopenicillin-N N-acyltransferase like protein
MNETGRASQETTVFPHVRVRGDSRQRGAEYGAQTRRKVHLSLEAYEKVFTYYTGSDWGQVRRAAEPYIAPIQAAHPAYLDEMRGIADGAGVEFEDVLALNLRTEIMYAAKARRALATTQPGECSSFCVMAEASATGHLLVGENWDWLTHCSDTTVVLEVEQEGKPDFVTVVEAGLLAKAGMNSSGVGIATNALVTDLDCGEPGLPYHVVLRSFFDAETLTEALVAVQAWVRSSSANYLLAHRDGAAVDIEAAPGDFSRLYYLLPRNGRITHTNHFLSALREDVTDVSQWAMPDSLIRLQRLSAGLDSVPRPIAVEAIQAQLQDHADYPFGVCCHPDPREHPVEQGATITSLIMDLQDRVLWIADGNPCSTPYRRVNYGDFLGKSSAAPRPADA